MVSSVKTFGFERFYPPGLGLGDNVFVSEKSLSLLLEDG